MGAIVHVAGNKFGGVVGLEVFFKLFTMITIIGLTFKNMNGGGSEMQLSECP